MDNSKILLIKLSPQFEEASRLIGAVIIGTLLMTAFSRADTPEDKRIRFNLYLDEFLIPKQRSLPPFISEARKFNIATCLHTRPCPVVRAKPSKCPAAGNHCFPSFRT